MQEKVLARSLTGTRRRMKRSWWATGEVQRMLWKRYRDCGKPGEAAARLDSSTTAAREQSYLSDRRALVRS